MSVSNSDCFPRDFLNMFGSSSLLIEDFQQKDVQQLAWNLSDIQAVIDFLYTHSYAITEIKLYGRDESGTFLIDSTELQERDTPDWATYCRKCKLISEKEIKNFSESNREMYCLLVPITESAYKARKKMPNNFPKGMICRAISLESLGIDDIAWHYEDALHAVQYCFEAHYAVLGGDVYVENSSHLNSTNDGWYSDQGDKTWIDYTIVSKETAISYIRDYFSRNGSHYCYSLIIQEEM